MKYRSLRATSLALCACLASFAEARPLPSFNALEAGGSRRGLPALSSEQMERVHQLASVAHTHSALGVPTFAWGVKPAHGTATLVGANHGTEPTLAARSYLHALADLYRVDPAEVDRANGRVVHTHPSGASIVRFHQQIGDIDVFHSELNVLLSRDRDLIATTGYLIPTELTARAAVLATPFSLLPRDALRVALGDASGLDVGQLPWVGGARGASGYWSYALPPGGTGVVSATQDARVRQVYYPTATELLPAYYVEVFFRSPAAKSPDAYSYVVSARDGAVLMRKNLTDFDTAYSYRVWADGSGEFIPYDGPMGNGTTPKSPPTPDGAQPAYVATNLVTLSHAVISTNDPWLPTGATTSRGNNVDAYADLVAPDGFGTNANPDGGFSDMRAAVTSGTAFDRQYNTGLEPNASAAQIQASITQIFYNINFFHDDYYDVGFKETDGNAQASNYGRGGLEGDPVHAEGQDYGGLNNANMTTPADGASPRMQMYLWTAFTTRQVVITAPASLAGKLRVGTADFGPQTYTLAGSVVYGNDAAGGLHQGCGAFTNAGALVGKIALVDRGTCTFVVKAQAAQAAGAVGVLIANNAVGLISGTGVAPDVTIPVMMLSQTDGAALEAHSAETISATLFREYAPQRDGTLDNSIMAHEWGHYISNRLIHNASGLNTNQSNGLGEGWADFHAMMMVVKAEDVAISGNDKYQGTYALASYALGGKNADGTGNNAFYYGIRRVPYSTTLAKDPLTLIDIMKGVTLPTGVDPDVGTDGANNAEVHNTGEIWATMLWECYATLLNDPGLTFAEARKMMRTIIVTSYKLMPVNPTILEARDAVLAAAEVESDAHYQAFWAAFAKRGAGVNAVAPARESTDNGGTVESFVLGGHLAVAATSVDDSIKTCDHDGVLDPGESGVFTISVLNNGSTRTEAVTGTVVSNSPALTVLNGGQVQFPAADPRQTVTGTVQVAIKGKLTAVTEASFGIQFSAPGLPDGGSSSELSVTVAYDDRLRGSATDNAEYPVTNWTTTQTAATPGHPLFYNTSWVGSNHVWTSDEPQRSDFAFESPDLNVSSGEDFGFTFTHAYALSAPTDKDGNTVYDDGVVLELSAAGGPWTDIGASAKPGYNGKVSATTAFGEASTNPLAGHEAFVGASANLPALQKVTVALGKSYAGKTVRIRFREATSQTGGGSGGGYVVDDIAMSGLTNLPFNGRLPDNGVCGSATGPIAFAGKDATVPPTTVVKLDGSGSKNPKPEALSYAWKQTGGPTVKLANASGGIATFTAPSKLGKDSPYTFELTVKNADGRTATDSVVVTVGKDPNGGCGCTTPGAAMPLVALLSLGGLVFQAGRQGRRRRFTPRA